MINLSNILVIGNEIYGYDLDLKKYKSFKSINALGYNLVMQFVLILNINFHKMVHLCFILSL